MPASAHDSGLLSARSLLRLSGALLLASGLTLMMLYLKPMFLEPEVPEMAAVPAAGPRVSTSEKSVALEKPPAPDMPGTVESTALANTMQAGRAIQRCVMTASGKLPLQSGTPPALQLSQTADDWTRLVSISAKSTGAEPTALAGAVCGGLAAASEASLRDQGVESFALAQLEQAAAAAARERMGQQLLALQAGQPRSWRAAIEDYWRKLPADGSLMTVLAVFVLLLILFLILMLRMTSMHRKLALIDRSVRYGTLAKQGSATHRVLNSAKALIEQGIYVAAADVELDQDPKVIVLTVANATQAPKTATAHFTFFNAAEQQVGDHRSPPFTVPAEGIYNLRTQVPANDGSWVKWRSEIRHAP